METQEKERIQLHRILKIVVVVTLLLVALALYLGISTARQMKAIIRDQFNQQQLALARTLAATIDDQIQNARNDLALLNSFAAIQYAEVGEYENLLLTALPVLYRDNLLEIRRVDRNGKILFIANDEGIGLNPLGLVYQEPAVYLSWARDSRHRGEIMGAALRPRELVNDKKAMVLDLVTPTYENSTNQLHPQPSHSFSGYLRVSLDVSRLLQRTVPSVKSGKTGYAWVLDSSGTFLYHPETSFIGESAFEVRSKLDPDISYVRINDIQRQEMVKGKEGSGTYLSARHRDVIGPLEKLIAYTPMRIQGPYLDYLWSVAVVAPVDEIEGIIHPVYFRQIVLQGIIIFLIFVGSVIVLLYELRWSTILEHEVAAKTEDIRHYTSELERSEAKYRSLVESAEDIIFTMDETGMIKTANHHTCHILGQPDGALDGQSLYRFLPRDQADVQLAMAHEVLQSGKGQRTEMQFHIQDNDLWLNIQYIPVKVSDDEHQYILGIGRDITDRKSLEKQLLSAEKLASLGTLAAGVAHEINNPIGIMLGFCDLLLEKMDPGTMEYNDLKTIERHGLHCKSIVERLLSFARIVEEDEQECELNVNIEDMVAVVKHTLNMNKIELLTRLSEGLPLVRFDSRGLKQVLLNLISNAVHAMNQGGILTIETKAARRNGWVELVVSDNGDGIRKEFMPKIFDPFFTTKKVGEGTGLGLAVSYGIVSKHGGTIECQSQTEQDAPGHSGTTFIISLQSSDQAFPEHFSEDETLHDASPVVA